MYMYMLYAMDRSGSSSMYEMWFRCSINYLWFNCPQEHSFFMPFMYSGSVAMNMCMCKFNYLEIIAVYETVFSKLLFVLIHVQYIAIYNCYN